MDTRQPSDPAAEIARAVDAYRETNDFSALLDRLLAIAERADLDALVAAVEPYRTIPEVAGPVYERVVAERPNDARALVTLANAYWLSGRGAEATGELAARALAADPENRGAWHLWALTEPDPRARMQRWRQVSERFPADDLARATLADAAASLAGAERDREALQLAIRCYDALLKTATQPEQRAALEAALTTLRGWNL
jgi:tetratricopeptide (TPR) repeat protein